MTGPAGAIISDCGTYRYLLWRQWDPGAYSCAFIMLNPSTADASQDDPTIRRCIGFAKGWGYGGVHVVNLFAYRATSPDDMKRAADPVGPENEWWVKHLVGGVGGPVIAAWGAHGTHMRQDTKMAEWARDVGVELQALALTASGQPRHPLYLPKNAQLMPYAASNANLPRSAA